LSWSSAVRGPETIARTRQKQWLRYTYTVFIERGAATWRAAAYNTSAILSQVPQDRHWDAPSFLDSVQQNREQDYDA
jgi:hypothetical protein